MRFEIFKGRGRHPWFVRLLAENGQVLLVSEGYFSRWNAKRSVKNFGIPVTVK